MQELKKSFLKILYILKKYSSFIILYELLKFKRKEQK